MNWTDILFNSFGGLGLFLMGMKFMSEGMQKAAGDKLRKTLNFLTSNRIFAITVGFLITALIQSSSATTVMVVGFVNASLMKLTQAIGVILGANIGTTVTGWIVTLKIVKYSMPIIGIGVFIRFFSKSEKWKFAGEIIFGFGILFLGMETMKNGFAPLRESPEFIHFFTKVDGVNYLSILMGVAIGTATTLIVQSSSATIGITIALASQGLLNLEGAVSLILGDNIGTTITAILASIGGNFQAKRAALAHMMFNILGVIFILFAFYPFIHLVEALIPGSANFTIRTSMEATKFGGAIGTKPFIGSHIAAAHSIFNITNVFIFAFLIPLLAKICEKIIPEPKIVKDISIPDFSHIETSAFEVPALGITETEKKLEQMAQIIVESSKNVKDLLNNNNDRTGLCDKVLEYEKILDNYKKVITEFLISLSSASLSEKDSHYIGEYITLTHNLEKFGDHLEHIALILDKLNRKKLKFPDEMSRDIKNIFKSNIDFFQNSFDILSFEDKNPERLEKYQVINRRIKKKIKDSKKRLFERIGRNYCQEDFVLRFMDVLNYLDGMRSQAFNISEITAGTKFG